MGRRTQPATAETKSGLARIAAWLTKPSVLLTIIILLLLIIPPIAISASGDCTFPDFGLLTCQAAADEDYPTMSTASIAPDSGSTWTSLIECAGGLQLEVMEIETTERGWTAYQGGNGTLLYGCKQESWPFESEMYCSKAKCMDEGCTRLKPKCDR